ncbi:MAG: c-type cytochrome [Thermomicrobiales bacterium]|nr:c-type cytochrome [Thermomicrobiales bacterium]MCO5217333.1 c-type cytochrome [Thermomicrobiales bacterium]MCO5226181.1 c-type cytochrome [Thermomicrobiales bacterium]MCO5228704.1 c-type cytochrome [Thermomicrobiales bacterium]
MTVGTIISFTVACGVSNDQANRVPTREGNIPVPTLAAFAVQPPAEVIAANPTSTLSVQETEPVQQYPTADIPVAGQTVTAVASKPSEDSDAIVRGKNLVTVCLACHSTDGSRLIGPSWLNLYGTERKLQSGETMIADEAYLMKAITDPGSEIAEGFPPSMPPFTFTPEELADIIAYIKSLNSD